MSGSTSHWGLPYPQGTDLVSDGPSVIQSLATKLDTVAMYSQGTYAARPGTVPASGSVYFATDTGQTFVSDGTNWQAVAPADAAANVASMRTLGTGATQAAAGNDVRLASVVSSLPGSPADGQQVLYLANGRDKWLLRYDASQAGAYKWEVLGAKPLFSEQAALDTITSATYVAPSNSGPQVTCPLAGTYEVEIGARIERLVSGSEFVFAYMSYQVGGTAASDDDALAQSNANGNGGYAAVLITGSRIKQKTVSAPSTTLASRYRMDGTTGSAAFTERWMRVTPLWVG